MTVTKPELLCPAGNFEKAMIAFLHGADAVYIGGSVFGLRKYADNFSLSEIRQLCLTARSLGKAVYVVLNAFAHNSDIDAIVVYLLELEKIQPDAVIVSDVGVAALVRQHSTLALHVSTQASVTNVYSGDFWKNLGAKRLILAREVPLSTCKHMKECRDIELEIFVHGAMCASYSGKCVISNYAAGRDSNRGGCVQSCRHRYQLIDPDTGKTDRAAHIMNAKDLMGIDALPEMMRCGIDSIKVEGRMKSNLYVANVAATYRKAIDQCYDRLLAGQDCDDDFLHGFKDQLAVVSNRQFSTGGLTDRPYAESIHYTFTDYEKRVEYVGSVRDVVSDSVFCDSKVSVRQGDSLLCLVPGAEPFRFSLDTLKNSRGQDCEVVHANCLFQFNSSTPLPKYSILAKCL